jgi:ADP-ribose pyrophosphatase
MRSPSDTPSGIDLIETKVAGEVAFQGALLQVHRDVVRLPDGQESLREYIRHPGAVMVVPVLADGSVLMERQFRYPSGRIFLEFPAGKIDPGESPLATGRRELLEETGYVADEWRYLTTIHPGIGYSDERIEIWLARGLVHQAAKLDAGEFLEVFSMTLTEGLAAVRDGRITDVKTVIGFFWLEKIRAGEWPASQDTEGCDK